jgi:hypothetical protein
LARRFAGGPDREHHDAFDPRQRHPRRDLDGRGFGVTDCSANERLTSLIDITPSPPRMQLVWTATDPGAPRVSAVQRFQATVEIAAT